jgi:hypothetical protein
VHDPWKDRPVHDFVLVHEKLFHAFVVSQDSATTSITAIRSCRATACSAFPLCCRRRDVPRARRFLPDGATPQLIAETLFVPGSAPAAGNAVPRLFAEVGSEHDGDAHDAAGAADRRQPHAGDVSRRAGRRIRKISRAWGHMLVASDDLIDMIHLHPLRADNGDVQFNIVFPRARPYRVWVQFQRNGIVNTCTSM